MKYIKSQPIDFTDPDKGRSSIGHKFHNWITGLYLAKLFNLEYIYSPFTEDAERFDSFLNLHTAYRSEAEYYYKYKLPPIDFCHENTSEEKLTESLTFCKRFINSIPETCLIEMSHNPLPGMLSQYYNKVVGELRAGYWAIPRDIDVMYSYKKHNIAIHIRRGDITLENNPDRWLDLSHYNTIIEDLNDVLGIGSTDIYIFSEGREQDFSSLTKPNVQLVLGGSDLSALHHMCSADILVTGQSSFSIMAAYFNINRIITTPLKNFMYKWSGDKIIPYNEIKTTDKW